jgi:glycosyltransferase involved in cell wall biosynthesis
MRLAYFSPLPPLKTGIATYSRHLTAVLARDFDLQVFHAGPCDPLPLQRPPIDYLRDPGMLSELSGYDAVLYHLGNNPWHHLDIYRCLLEHPGIVVLHDAVLYYLASGLGRGGLIKEFCLNYGLGRLPELWQIIESSPQGDVLRYKSPASYPLIARVLEHASAIIVHSKTTAAAVQDAGYKGQVHAVELPFYPEQLARAKSVDLRALRQLLGISKDRIVLGTFGFIGPTKRTDKVLEALGALRQKHDFVLLIVGEGDDVSKKIRKRHLQDRVIQVGFVDDEKFADYLMLADIIVSLRYPSMGESSATLIQALALGKPCIVTDHAWFSELPDSCAWKIGYGESEVEELLRALENLIEDPMRCEVIGGEAQRYALDNCAPGKVATRYREIIVSETSARRSFGYRVDLEMDTYVSLLQSRDWAASYLQKRVAELISPANS